MRKLLFLLSMATLVGACKKDGASDPAPTTSRTDLLTAKPWQVATIALSVNGIPFPSSTVASACQLDDTYKFNADKTVVVDEGPTKCSPSDPQTTTGTWAFANTDQTKITITVPGSIFSGDADIKELSASTLHLNTTQSRSGITYTVDATFSPK